MTKKLKVEFPMATAFPHQATLLSILQSYKECEEWIFSNYIQIFSARKLNEGPGVVAKFDFFYTLNGDYRYFELRTNPWLQYHKIPLYMLSKTNNSICNFLVNCIDNEEYIWLPVNRSYIKKYQSQGFHVQFIYGYDLDNQIFYCGDNYKGKYSFEKIPFSEIELAVKNVTDQADLDLGTEGITLLKFYYLEKWNEKFSRYAFNKAKVINDIKEYLLFDNYGMGYRLNKFYSFGIECYDSLINYWKDSYENFNDKKHIDLRALCSFLDHKNIMVKRMEFMIEKGILNDKTFIERYKNIYKEVNAIVYLIIEINLKYQFTFEELNNLILLFSNCKKDEIEFLNEILIELDKKETIGTM